jgi:hypothetical protein
MAGKIGYTEACIPRAPDGNLRKTTDKCSDIG